MSPGDLLLRPQPGRVVLRPFVPVENGGVPHQDRPRVERILERVLQRRFYDIVDRHVGARTVGPEQKLLAGAYVTEEYSFEAAALFNWSCRCAGWARAISRRSSSAPACSRPTAR